jgi:hypothetical protein
MFVTPNIFNSILNGRNLSTYSVDLAFAFVHEYIPLGLQGEQRLPQPELYWNISRKPVQCKILI